MVDLIEDKRAQLEALCVKYAVQSLDVFGSAAMRRFDRRASDLDFLVTFNPHPHIDPFHQYFDFLEQLQLLFQRDVDLVEAEAMTNPYFVRAVNQSRSRVFAA